MTPLHDEKKVLQKVAEGDEAAFTLLFHNYHHLLGHHIYRLTESREMTEEIVQDVFLKIWSIREGLTEITDFRSWLFTIAKNHSLNAIRQIARQRVRQRQWEKEIRLENDLPELNSNWSAIIEKAVDTLPPQQKKVYHMSRQDGLTYKQIADQLGLSHETVKYYMKITIATITRHIKEQAGLAAALMLITMV